MNEHTQHEQEPPQQQVRIQLCGPFQIAWGNLPSDQHLLSLTDLQKQHRDIPQALSLLKMLLCRPGRQASRDWLLEQFWPEHARSAASSRLDNVLTALRKVLHSLPNGETLLHTSRGTSTYHLAPYPQLWVDSDALAWQVEHAVRLERFGDDALPAWERAFTLLKRGPFLLDEPYASWAHAQRNELEGHARQCTHALAHLYLTRFGEKGTAEALLLLRTYWQQHPTDEDALRLLMELLGQQERYQEAEAYYQQFLVALEEEGLSTAPDLRTWDLHAFLQSKPLQRASSSATSHTPMVQLAQHTTPMPDTQPTLVPYEHGSMLPLTLSVSLASRDTLDLATWFGARANDLKAYGAFWSGAPITCQQQQAFIHTELEGWTTMTNLDHSTTKDHHVTRRTALATLATLSTSLLTKVQCGQLTTFVMEEFLAHCATSLTTCWHLLNGDGIATVKYALPKYLPLLVSIALQPSKYQKTAAYLGSQGSLLMGLVEYHQLRFEQWVAFCHQAVRLAELSHDRNLHAYGLLLFGSALGHSGQSEAFLQKLQEASHAIHDVTPLLGSHVLAQLALAYAQNGQTQDALRSIGEARNLLGVHSKDTPYFITADYGIFSLLLFEGRMHLALRERNTDHEGQHNTHAKTALVEIDTLEPTIMIPQRLSAEVMNYRAEAALGLKDMEEFKHYLVAGANSAKALGSQKRLQEVVASWQTARKVWPQERQILELADALI